MKTGKQHNSFLLSHRRYFLIFLLISSWDIFFSKQDFKQITFWFLVSGEHGFESRQSLNFPKLHFSILHFSGLFVLPKREDDFFACSSLLCPLPRSSDRKTLWTGQGGCFDRDDDEVADTPRCVDYTYVCTDQPVDTCKSISGLDPIHNYMGCTYHSRQLNSWALLIKTKN